jgi:PAS domain S-box-containing protein
MAVAEVGQVRKQSTLSRIFRPNWRAGSTLLVLASLVLLIVALLFDVSRPTLTLAILISLLGTIAALVLAFSRTSRRLHHDQRDTASALQSTSNELRQMADNIQEIFWAIDPKTRKGIFVNPAYETITGRSCQSLKENPSSYEDVIHSDDRVYALAKLEEAAQTGRFDERFRIVRPDGEIRWVWVRGFPVRDTEGNITRLVGTALDITAQKQAEDQVATNLAIAKSAWAEEEALRKATLALTQDLHMGNVMATLLRSLAEVVPYTCARVMVPEGGPHWLALGERVVPEPRIVPESEDKTRKPPLTIVDTYSPLVRRVSEARKSVLIRDTANEADWQTFKGHKYLRSWLSVPLIASGEYLGFLSVGHAEPNQLTDEHLRRAELLAIPAAAAIENARLYTRAEIYASELEKRLKDLNAAETALLQAQADRKISEDRFQKVFRSNPVPFSITTCKEGKFMDVNAAFERRYGYSREELLGHTVHEIRIWEDLSDRVNMLLQLQRGQAIRNIMTRLRTKSGELKVTAYSADKIQFDGQECVLIASEDVIEYDVRKAN